MRHAVSALLLLVLAACASDHVAVFQGSGGPRDGGSDGGSSSDGAAADSGDAGADGGNADGGNTDGGSPLPGPGELVLTELMIDPSAVGDAQGEWVELYNPTDRSIELAGLVLGDDNIDAWVLTDSVALAPGAWAVLCAAETDNGGAACAGTFRYNTLGGGFALANAGDEVVLRTGDGLLVDRTSYGAEAVVPGASLGLSPAALDAVSNDGAGAWCAQHSPMSGGDRGTPGRPNDPC